MALVTVRACGPAARRDGKGNLHGPERKTGKPPESFEFRGLVL